MIFEWIEWDEHNPGHATMRLTVAEINRALWNAAQMKQHPRHPDRGIIASVTDGGKKVTIIVKVLHGGVRPITGWEE